MNSTDADLTTTRDDAAQGQGDQCSNLTTVSGDATDTVGGDVTNTVGGDVTDTLGLDLDILRAQITSVSSDENQLASDGLPPIPGVQQTILAAQRQVGDTVASTNRLIDHANADLIAAYRVPNQLATGNCAGLGSGNPSSSLLSHIK